jgi:hypothetical protein
MRILVTGGAEYEARRTLDDGIQELFKGYRMLRRVPLRNV